MFFTREKGEQYRLQGYLRRICDLTSPNLPRLDECRGNHRQNRTIPVLLAPWENGTAVTDEVATGLTKDISDCGFSVTLPQPFRADEVVVGIWLPQVKDGDPWFFLGVARQNAPIGGGYWGLGIEVSKLLKPTAKSGVASLTPLAKKLLLP